MTHAEYGVFMLSMCRNHRKDGTLPSYLPDTCQVLLRTFCTIFAQHPCYSLGVCTSAFAEGEISLVSLQVFSGLAISEREGKNTLSLDLRK